MRAVVQRVSRASVSVGDEVLGGFDEPGLVVLVGVTTGDGDREVAWLAAKVAGLRILHDERSVSDVGAPVMVVSQFTLYGDARKGRRPTWLAAAPGPVAEPVYDQVCAALEDMAVRVVRGRFGADMAISLVNDGPMTLVLEPPFADSPRHPEAR